MARLTWTTSLVEILQRLGPSTNTIHLVIACWKGMRVVMRLNVWQKLCTLQNELLLQLHNSILCIQQKIVVVKGECIFFPILIISVGKI